MFDQFPWVLAALAEPAFFNRLSTSLLLFLPRFHVNQGPDDAERLVGSGGN